jgi:hypothetical protein
MEEFYFRPHWLPIHIYIEENFITFLETKTVQRISKHFLNDVEDTSGCFRAHMERLLTLYNSTSTKIRKITCIQLNIVWHQPENRNALSIIFKENALKQMFIWKQKHSKPITTTWVYATHLLWRQTFCGATWFLTVNYNLVLFGWNNVPLQQHKILSPFHDVINEFDCIVLPLLKLIVTSLYTRRQIMKQSNEHLCQR